MSAPVRGVVYVHIPTGERFRFIGVSATTCGVVLTRIVEPVDPDYYVVPIGSFNEKFANAEDLLAVAELAHATAPQDQVGRQPLVEFTDGPVGAAWSDENLASVFGLDWSTGDAS